MITTVSTCTVSTRTINGINYPVNVTLTRIEHAGRFPVWCISEVCNGGDFSRGECYNRDEAEDRFDEVVSGWAHWGR